MIGPFEEGYELRLSAFTAEPAANGVGTGISRLQVTLGRGDLGAKFECRAASRALDSPLLAAVEVDVN
ncbi:hypothetical protein B566_EDAN003929, partial [Ephemera danica]